eukprot:TRINITY_DN10032_c0_g1_i2.p1 TRINITY_DN10032_c0_g1~~TRINITY_DN10032_c0_g1_i2.p1  ORF type:complete len:2926 (-),score=856.52 TRINITY_DN10032_c0_g1_i2:109-8886(-)
MSRGAFVSPPGTQAGPAMQGLADVEVLEGDLLARFTNRSRDSSYLLSSKEMQSSRSPERIRPTPAEGFSVAQQRQLQQLQQSQASLQQQLLHFQAEGVAAASPQQPLQLQQMEAQLQELQEQQRRLQLELRQAAAAGATMSPHGAYAATASTATSTFASSGVLSQQLRSQVPRSPGAAGLQGRGGIHSPQAPAADDDTSEVLDWTPDPVLAHTVRMQQQQRQQAVALQQNNDLFGYLDRNHDGVISHSEWMNGMAPGGQYSAPSMPPPGDAEVIDMPPTWVGAFELNGGGSGLLQTMHPSQLESPSAASLFSPRSPRRGLSPVAAALHGAAGLDPAHAALSPRGAPYAAVGQGFSQQSPGLRGVASGMSPTRWCLAAREQPVADRSSVAPGGSAAASLAAAELSRPATPQSSAAAGAAAASASVARRSLGDSRSSSKRSGVPQLHTSCLGGATYDSDAPLSGGEFSAAGSRRVSGEAPHRRVTPDASLRASGFEELAGSSVAASAVGSRRASEQAAEVASLERCAAAPGAVPVAALHQSAACLASSAVGSRKSSLGEGPMPQDVLPRKPSPEALGGAATAPAQDVQLRSRTPTPPPPLVRNTSLRTEEGLSASQPPPARSCRSSSVSNTRQSLGSCLPEQGARGGEPTAMSAAIIRGASRGQCAEQPPTGADSPAAHVAATTTSASRGSAPDAEPMRMGRPASSDSLAAPAAVAKSASRGSAPDAPPLGLRRPSGGKGGDCLAVPAAAATSASRGSAPDEVLLGIGQPGTGCSLTPASSPAPSGSYTLTKQTDERHPAASSGAASRTAAEEAEESRRSSAASNGKAKLASQSQILQDADTMSPMPQQLETAPAAEVLLPAGPVQKNEKLSLAEHPAEPRRRTSAAASLPDVETCSGPAGNEVTADQDLPQPAEAAILASEPAATTPPAASAAEPTAAATMLAAEPPTAAPEVLATEPLVAQECVSERDVAEPDAAEPVAAEPEAVAANTAAAEVPAEAAPAAQPVAAPSLSAEPAYSPAARQAVGAAEEMASKKQYSSPPEQHSQRQEKKLPGSNPSAEPAADVLEEASPADDRAAVDAPDSREPVAVARAAVRSSLLCLAADYTEGAPPAAKLADAPTGRVSCAGPRLEEGCCTEAVRPLGEEQEKENVEGLRSSFGASGKENRRAPSKREVSKAVPGREKTQERSVAAAPIKKPPPQTDRTTKVTKSKPLNSNISSRLLRLMDSSEEEETAKEEDEKKPEGPQDEASSEEDEAVAQSVPTLLRPQLRECFAEAALPERYAVMADAWCRKVGAVNMEEVKEFSSDLEKHIGLKIFEQRRFRKAMEMIGQPEERADATSEAAASRRSSANTMDLERPLRESQPAARRGESPKPELLPGLRNLLQDALLEDLQPAVEDWAEDVGIDSLAELIEYVDELEANVEMKVMDKRRLRTAAASWQVATCSPGKNRTARGSVSRGNDASLAAKPPAAQKQRKKLMDLAALFAAAQLPHLLNDAEAWCDSMGVKTIEEVAAVTDSFERHLGLRPVELRAYKKALAAQLAAADGEVSGGAVPQGTPAMNVELPGLPGLFEVLSTARLLGRLHETQEWCEEMGASTVHELAEYSEDLGKHLGLKELEQKRLNMAFAAYTGTHDCSPPAVKDQGSRLPVQLMGGSQRLLGRRAGGAPVKGFPEMLVEVQLANKEVAATGWCQEMGVSCWDDVREFMEGLMEHLQLKELERRRLRPAVIDRANAEAEKRSREQEAATRRVMKAAESAPVGTSDATSVGANGGAILGLQELMTEARLGHALEALQSCCEKHSICELEQVARQADLVATQIGLKSAEKRRFDKALEKAAEIAAALRQRIAEREAEQKRQHRERSMQEKRATLEQEEDKAREERQAQRARDKVEAEARLAEAQARAETLEMEAIQAELAALRSAMWDLREVVLEQRILEEKAALQYEVPLVRRQNAEQRWKVVKKARDEKRKADEERKRKEEEERRAKAEADAKAKKGKKNAPPPPPVAQPEPERIPITAEHWKVFYVVRFCTRLKRRLERNRQYRAKMKVKEKREREERKWRKPETIEDARAQLHKLFADLESIRGELRVTVAGEPAPARESTKEKYFEAEALASAAKEAALRAAEMEAEAAMSLERLARGSLALTDSHLEAITDQLTALASKNYQGKTKGPELSDDGVIPGLKSLLDAAMLSSYYETALTWCEDNGVTTKEQLIDDLECFLDDLGLKRLQRHRLLQVVASVCQRSKLPFVNKLCSAPRDGVIQEESQNRRRQSDGSSNAEERGEEQDLPAVSQGSLRGAPAESQGQPVRGQAQGAGANPHFANIREDGERPGQVTQEQSSELLLPAKNGLRSQENGGAVSGDGLFQQHSQRTQPAQLAPSPGGADWVQNSPGSPLEAEGILAASRGAEEVDAQLSSAAVSRSESKVGSRPAEGGVAETASRAPSPPCVLPSDAAAASGSAGAAPAIVEVPVDEATLEDRAKAVGLFCLACGDPGDILCRCGLTTEAWEREYGGIMEEYVFVDSRRPELKYSCLCQEHRYYIGKLPERGAYEPVDPEDAPQAEDAQEAVPEVGEPGNEQIPKACAAAAESAEVEPEQAAEEETSSSPPVRPVAAAAEEPQPGMLHRRSSAGKTEGEAQRQPSEPEPGHLHRRPGSQRGEEPAAADKPVVADAPEVVQREEEPRTEETTMDTKRSSVAEDMVGKLERRDSAGSRRGSATAPETSEGNTPTPEALPSTQEAQSTKRQSLLPVQKPELKRPSLLLAAAAEKSDVRRPSQERRASLLAPERSDARRPSQDRRASLLAPERTDSRRPSQERRASLLAPERSESRRRSSAGAQKSDGKRPSLLTPRKSDAKRPSLRGDGDGGAGESQRASLAVKDALVLSAMAHRLESERHGAQDGDEDAEEREALADEEAGQEDNPFENMDECF